MQKSLIFLALFFFAPLLAQEEAAPLVPPQHEESSGLQKKYWKFHHAAYMGYRRDRQQFNTYGSGFFDTRTAYKARDTIQIMASTHAEFHNIVGYLRGSYGWLANGRTKFRVPGATPPLSFPHFALGAGYTTEAKGALAYRFSFYDRPHFGFSFLPGFGYRYASMVNMTEGQQRYIPPGANELAIVHLPNPNHQDWFGPFVDARVELRFSQFCEWLLSCQYHQPYLISKSKSEIEIYQYAGGSLTADTLYRMNSILRSPSTHMLSGMSDLKFHYKTGWTFGLNFEGASSWSHKASDHAILKQETLTTSPSSLTETRANNRATLQWTFYSASLMVGHTF